MKILCINPNSSKEVTEGIKKTCLNYTLPATDIKVEYLKDSPEGIESYQDVIISQNNMLEKFKNWEKEYDGFIVACHSDVGVDMLREISVKPVIGIGEASMLFALPLGHKFTILSLKGKKIPQKEELVKKYGLESRCASIRATGLGVVATEEEKREKLLKEGSNALKYDRAEVLILGCAGMAGLDKFLGEKLNVPVIDGLVCALMMIESFLRYGVKTSKIAKYMSS